MDDFNTLKQNATNLRKQKSFKEAAAAYQMLWENFQAECNEWEGWGYAFSLRKAKNVELAYQISQQVFEKWPDFPNNRGVLAWCIFDMDVDKDAAEISPNESNYFGAVNKILKLVVQDTCSGPIKLDTPPRGRIRNQNRGPQWQRDGNLQLRTKQSTCWK
jgi:hypothetical protein